MRAAVAIVVGLGAAIGAAAPARADGELTLRGVWYKEKATRVVQPMLDARFDVGDDAEVTAHALVDSITSASVAAGALGEPFNEKRWEVGGGYRRQVGDVRVGMSGRVSHEPDYDSVFAGVRVELDLRDKTTVLGLGAGGGHDWIRRTAPAGLGSVFAEQLSVVLGSVSLTQILSRTAVAGLTYDVSHLEGFQANPYRSAITADGLVDERHPHRRTRHAVAASLRRYVPATGTAVIASHRVYTDSWGVLAHTPELRIVQEAGDGMDVSVRYRFHTQGAADFYMRSYPSADLPYLSDDVKLSAFTSHLVGIKFGGQGWVIGLPGRLADARGELVIEYIDQNNRFGNAVVAHVALTLPFE